MKKNQENTEDLINKIADGNVIEWDNVKGEDLIDQLKIIQHIFQQHKQFRDTPGYKEKENSELLFSWGHLQVLEKIGEGNYGKVYKAYDSILDRNVALKILKKNHMEPYQSRIFIQEARRLAKVRNPHVLAIHGANIYDNNAGMWSDLIHGNNLSSDKNSEKNYTSTELLMVVGSLAEALKAVHRSNLIHGDIKPSNVMYDNQDQLILMDFGTSIEKTEKIKKDDYVSGTPLFMAPELFSGEALTPASDIYAFGVLLFKLASGNYPIIGNNIIDLDLAHEKQKYVDIKTMRPDLPKHLLKLIQSMLSVDASIRPTANDILVKLDWLKTLPQRRSKRMALSVVLLSLLVTTLVSTFGFFKIKNSQAIAVQEQKKTQTVNQFLQQMLGSAANLGKGREVRVADILDVAAKDVNSGFKNQPKAKAAMLDALGQSFLHLKLPNKSIAQLQKSLALKQKWYSPDSLEMLKTQLDLAKSYGIKGEIDKSIKLHHNLLQLAEQNSEIKNNFLQLINISLANNLSENGQLEEAKEKYDEILNQFSKYNNSDLNLEFLVLHGLSSNYRKQSKYIKAEEIAQLALTKLQEKKGHSKSNLITIKNELAIILVKLGKLEKAEKLFSELLQHSKNLYGSNNLGYLTILSNLGNILQMRGNLSEALKIQQQAIELSNEIHGENHRKSIMINVSMANTIVSIGDKVTGEKLMQETLIKSRRELGESDIETLKLEYNLAELLNNLGKFELAESIAKNNNLKMRDLLGEKHLFTLLSKDNLAVSLTGQKQYQQAQSLFQQTLSSIKNTVSEESPYMILVQDHYVTMLIKSKQTQKAIEQLKLLIKLQTHVFGDKHKDTLKSIEKLTELTI